MENSTKVIINDLNEVDVILKIYEQYCYNLRSFIELRFKHFTTYIAINSLIGVGVYFKISDWLVVVMLCHFSFIVTLLFWMIDFRTMAHIRETSENICFINNIFSENLNLKKVLTLHKKKKLLCSATLATNLLFLLFITGWFYVMLHAIFKHFFK